MPLAFARFHVGHQLERADIGSAEGKDRLVNELRAVFADIPSSVVREDLIARVAEHLALQPQLVSLWMPTPPPSCEQSEPERGFGRVMAERKQGPRDLLAECVQDARAAVALPSGTELETLFPDALERRAAEHIRSHPSDPTADLPASDHELIAFITSLLTTPAIR